MAGDRADAHSLGGLYPEDRDSGGVADRLKAARDAGQGLSGGHDVEHIVQIRRGAAAGEVPADFAKRGLEAPKLGAERRGRFQEQVEVGDGGRAQSLDRCRRGWWLSRPRHETEDTSAANSRRDPLSPRFRLGVGVADEGPDNGVSMRVAQQRLTRASDRALCGRMSGSSVDRQIASYGGRDGQIGCVDPPGAGEEWSCSSRQGSPT
jgi:hypothetical protein